MHYYSVLFFFFFQAEDGIRDGHVTGVQTCALPIWGFGGFRALTCTFTVPLVLAPCWICWITRPDLHKHRRPRGHRSSEIGRASCRERVEIAVVDVSLEKERYR